jgi:hypothetical protein
MFCFWRALALPHPQSQLDQSSSKTCTHTLHPHMFFIDHQFFTSAVRVTHAGVPQPAAQHTH